MNDIWIVVQTEVVRRIRSRAYIVGTIFGAIGLVLVGVLPSLLDDTIGSSAKRIVLAGPPSLTAPARRLLAADYDVVAVMRDAPPHPNADFLERSGASAALVVLRESRSGIDVTVYARDAGAVRSALASDLAPLNVAIATKIPQSRVERLFTVPVKTRSLDATFSDQDSAEAARGVALAMVTILYFSIVLNAQNILASVAEEKTSRIAELLVAMISPVRLLAGKIVAATVTGLLQITEWLLVAAAATPLIVAQFAGPSAATAAPPATMVADIARSVGPGVIAAFVVFFVMGWLQFALMYAAAASLVSRTEDLSGVVGPLVIPVLAGFITAQVAVSTPHASAIAALSLVPLISPFVMFARIAVATIPAWQIALSVAINAAAIVLIALAAGKIYRIGLLTYGRPPKLAQVWAVLRS